MNAKAFNLMSGKKQKLNHDEFRCECKGLDDWGSCKNDYMCNPRTCDCECKKSCKIDYYLDVKYCSSKKRLFRKSVN